MSEPYSPFGRDPRNALLTEADTALLGGERTLPEIKVLVEGIARVVHEANRAYNVMLGDPAPDAPWDAIETWHRRSIIHRVIMFIKGYTPQEIHLEWVTEMKKRGWVLGEAKDPAATPPTHPCLKEWILCPEAQQKKEILAYSIVRSLIPDPTIMAFREMVRLSEELGLYDELQASRPYSFFFSGRDRRRPLPRLREPEGGAFLVPAVHAILHVPCLQPFLYRLLSAPFSASP